MTVLTTRPDATVANGCSLVSTATTRHGATSDDSDASYVYFGTGWPGDVKLGFAEPSIPADSTPKSVGVRARVWVAAGQTHRLNWRLATGVDIETGAKTVNWSSPTTVSLGSVVATGSPTAIQVDLGQADDPIANGGPAIVELYVDTTYVAQPDLTVDSPTGTITTDNAPTVAWTPSLDSDGGAQTFYEVKVFDDATYGAAGFDAATATPDTESGILVGNATSWDVDQAASPLGDDTYKAYVRIAQTVNGEKVWSDWTAGSAFTIDVLLPAVPTITVTAEDAEARNKIAITEGASGDVVSDRYRIQRSRDGGSSWEDVRTVDGDGEFGLLTRVGGASQADTANATSHSFSLPSPFGAFNGIQAGDLLIAYVAFDGNPTITWPSDWTELKDEAGNANAVRFGCAYKFAAGGETGSIEITTSASEGGAIFIDCWRGADPDTPPEISSGVSGATANPNPGVLNPSWDVEDTVWIAVGGNDGNVVPTAGPTGYYSETLNSFANQHWANTEGADVFWARRRARVASEDPGAFTLASAEDWRVYTVAIRPKDALSVVYDYEAGNSETVSYRVQALHVFPNTATTSSSDWTSAELVGGWSSTSWQLKHPTNPGLNMVVVPRSQPSRQRQARQGVFSPLGRSDPIVISDVRGGWTGELVLRLDTAAEQTDLDALLDEQVPLLLQAPADASWDDAWLSLGDQNRERVVDNANFTATFDSFSWTEVAAPTDDLTAWS